MNYLILSPVGVTYLGDSIASVTRQCSPIAFDFDARCVKVNGLPDSVSIGLDYNGDELIRELGYRALVLLRRRGYNLYSLNA